MLQVHIRVREQIGGNWADWLSGLSICHTDDGGSSLTGLMSDQSALYGLLVKLRDLGLSLAAVSCDVAGTAGDSVAHDTS